MLVMYPKFSRFVGAGEGRVIKKNKEKKCYQTSYSISFVSVKKNSCVSKIHLLLE